MRSVIVQDFKPSDPHVSCVQDAVSLFGSQEEGELGSAARHLSCVGKVCGQRPNGEERNKQHAKETACGVFMYAQTYVA